MRKRFFLLTLILILGMVGCHRIGADEETTTTKEIPVNTTTFEQEETTILDVETTIPPEETTTEEETTTPSDEIPFCPIDYRFPSIQDMEVYLNTRSLDPNDYIDYAGAPFELYMGEYSSSWNIAEYPHVPVCEIFSLDEANFEAVEGFFGYRASGLAFDIYYTYCMDNLVVTVFSLLPDSAETMQESVVGWLEKKEGLSEKQYGDITICYQTEEGFQTGAFFVWENFYICIYPVRTPFGGDETIEVLYQDFLTNPRTAFLARLFSDDDTVVQLAVDEMLVRLEQTDGTEAAT